MRNIVELGRTVVKLVLCFSCAAFVGDSAQNPNQLTWWWSSGDPTVIRPALECALSRIRAATCLSLDVSFDAWHLVRQAPASAMGGRSGWTTGTWDESRTKLLDTLTPAQVCPVLIHEIVHVLRRSDAHPGADGSFSALAVHVSSQPVSKLTAQDIGLICAQQTCGCAIPEP